MTSYYDPDSQLTMSALSRMKGAGIPVITSLDTLSNVQFLRHIALLSIYPFSDILSVLHAWLSPTLSRLPPTWRNLLLIIRLLNLDDLAKRIESYLSEFSPTSRKQGEGNSVSCSYCHCVCYVLCSRR